MNNNLSKNTTKKNYITIIFCCFLFLFLFNTNAKAETNGKFVKTGSMHYARVNPTAVLLNNGKVIIASEGTAELYDPNKINLNLTKGQFTLLKKMTLKYINNASIALPENKAVFFGSDGNGVEIYDYNSNKFSYFDVKTHIEGNNIKLSLLNDKEILISDISKKKTNKIFNISTGQMEETTNYSLNNNEPCLLSNFSNNFIHLKDSKYLVYGVFIDKKHEYYFRLYDSTTNSYHLLNPIYFRGYTTNVKLKSGNILILGGLIAIDEKNKAIGIPIVQGLGPGNRTMQFKEAELYIPIQN